MGRVALVLSPRWQQWWPIGSVQLSEVTVLVRDGAPDFLDALDETLPVQIRWVDALIRLLRYAPKKQTPRQP
jgi:hypothetical protein